MQHPLKEVRGAASSGWPLSVSRCTVASDRNGGPLPIDSLCADDPPHAKRSNVTHSCRERKRTPLRTGCSLVVKL